MKLAIHPDDLADCCELCRDWIGFGLHNLLFLSLWRLYRLILYECLAKQGLKFQRKLGLMLLNLSDKLINHQLVRQKDVDATLLAEMRVTPVYGFGY